MTDLIQKHKAYMQYFVEKRIEQWRTKKQVVISDFDNWSQEGYEVEKTFKLFDKTGWLIYKS